jgi:hypothetical protein
MGNINTHNKLNFEDIQHAITNTNTYVIITTVNANIHTCLIQGTLPIETEETVINSLINSGKYKDINIIVYGLNCNDLSIHPKVKQLKSLGFYKVFIYIGGLFEWLLLQDIYGQSNFQTTSVEKDLLKYKPSKIF